METLADALAGAAEKIAAHLLGNTPHNVADQVRRELAEKPPTPDKAHAARVTIVTTTSHLLREQRICF